MSKRTEETVNETISNIEFFRKRNKVEGFSLDPYTYVKDTIDEYGEKVETTRNVLNIGLELLFRMLYPNGKIFAETLEKNYFEEDGKRTSIVDTCTARAYIYLDKNDPKDAFVVSEIGYAIYNPLRPEIGIESAAHTYARTKALQKLGIGAEYGFPNSFYKNEEDVSKNRDIKVEEIIRKAVTENADDRVDKTSSNIPDSKYEEALNHVCTHPSFAGIKMKNIARRSASFIKALATGSQACSDASPEDIKCATIIFSHDVGV